MTFKKQFLIVSALVAALCMPQRAYSQITVGEAATYAGVTVIFSYMFYSWYHQKPTKKKPVTAPAPKKVEERITADELFRSITATFKTGTEDFYADYLSVELRDNGYRMYLPEDTQKIMELLDTMRLFVNQIPHQGVPNFLHYEIDLLQEVLYNELAESERHIDCTFRQEIDAHAARTAYYVECFNAIVVNAASQQK